MFTIPGILLLLGVIYMRPQEFIAALRSLPLLYICVTLALSGLAIDLRLGRLRAIAAPQLLWALVFMAWCLLTLGLRNRSDLPSNAPLLGTALILYILIAHGVQTFRMLQVVIGVLLTIVLCLSFIGVHQGLSPFGCHRVDPVPGENHLVSDGRSCTTVRDCTRGDSEPGADYECERDGLFDTTTIGNGRVRYRGPLQDPNELSLALAIGLPFAFAFVERKRTKTRIVLLLTTLVVVGVCTVMTQSRGGQLVFLVVLGVYLIRRLGIKGLLLCAILSTPIVLLGGRSGEEAESSSVERIECWYEGISMLKEHPILGVGQAQFVEHHTQTAHNSYVLAAAELGFPGLVLFSILLYLSLKIPIQLLRNYSPSTKTDVARTWAMALLASQVGLLVGIFFLSFCYHSVLWIYLGLTGALYQCIRRHDESFCVRLTWSDLLLVTAFDLGLVATLFLYTRLKMAW